MNQLIHDFDTLSAAFNIFAARFDRYMTTVAAQAANTTLPSPVSIIDQAKARARADMEARIKERIAQLTAPKMTVKPAFPVMHTERSTGQQYLDRVHAEQQRLEAERASKRKVNHKSKFQRTCEAVRATNPSMSYDEVLVAARMRLSLKEHANQIPVLIAEANIIHDI